MYETEPDSQFHLTKEKAKPSLWSRIGGGALAFAISVAGIAVVILAYWYFTIPPKPPKNVDFMPPGGGGGQRAADSKVNQKRQKQIVPNTNVKRVFAEGAASTFTIPDQSDTFGEMSPLASISGGGMSGGLGGSGLGKGFGKGNGNGAGMGNGGGVGKLFGLIPETMRKRCTKEDRLSRIAETGGTPECEVAVENALRWLKSKQQPDGSWTGQSKAAMTGLALLAYFGHCETPASKEFGDSCLRGITYLVNIGLKNEGKLADNFVANSWCYEHAIATYALGEAATFCKEIKQDVPGLTEVVEKAGQFIIDNQCKNGGWAYLYQTADIKGKKFNPEKNREEDTTAKPHTDVSVVGWQIQALKACSHTGIRYRGLNGCITQGLRYIEDCQDKSGGYGYNNPALHGNLDYHTLTGVGMLCHQMWGKGNSPDVRKAGDYVMDKSKFDYNGIHCDLYGHYYESQAMMQLGGKYWQHYNTLYRDQLLKNQNPDGSWKKPGGNLADDKVRAVAPSYRSNEVYRTCLCTLMLEVYYRFLSTGGGGARENRGI